MKNSPARSKHWAGTLQEARRWAKVNSVCLDTRSKAEGIDSVFKRHKEVLQQFHSPYFIKICILCRFCTLLSLWRSSDTVVPVPSLTSSQKRGSLQAEAVWGQSKWSRLDHRAAWKNSLKKDINWGNWGRCTDKSLRSHYTRWSFSQTFLQTNSKQLLQILTTAVI